MAQVSLLSRFGFLVSIKALSAVSGATEMLACLVRQVSHVRVYDLCGPEVPLKHLGSWRVPQMEQVTSDSFLVSITSSQMMISVYLMRGAASSFSLLSSESNSAHCSDQLDRRILEMEGNFSDGICDMGMGRGWVASAVVFDRQSSTSSRGVMALGRVTLICNSLLT